MVAGGRGHDPVDAGDTLTWFFDRNLLKFEGFAVRHTHVILYVGVIHDLILSENQVFLLPFPTNTLALLVDAAFLDGYGAA